MVVGDITDLCHHIHHDAAGHICHHCNSPGHFISYNIGHCPCGLHSSQSVVVEIQPEIWRPIRGYAVLIEKCPAGGYHLDKALIFFGGLDGHGGWRCLRPGADYTINDGIISWLENGEEDSDGEKS